MLPQADHRERKTTVEMPILAVTAKTIMAKIVPIAIAMINWGELFYSSVLQKMKMNAVTYSEHRCQ